MSVGGVVAGERRMRRRREKGGEPDVVDCCFEFRLAEAEGSQSDEAISFSRATIFFLFC